MRQYIKGVSINLGMIIKFLRERLYICISVVFKCLQRLSKYYKPYTLHDYKHHHSLLEIFGISVIASDAASLILHKVSKRLGSIRQIYCKSCHINTV